MSKACGMRQNCDLHWPVPMHLGFVQFFASCTREFQTWPCQVKFSRHWRNSSSCGDLNGCGAELKHALRKAHPLDATISGVWVSLIPPGIYPGEIRGVLGGKWHFLPPGHMGHSTRQVCMEFTRFAFIHYASKVFLVKKKHKKRSPKFFRWIQIFSLYTTSLTRNIKERCTGILK